MYAYCCVECDYNKKVYTCRKIQAKVATRS